MTAHAWRSPCLLLAAPVLFFAAFFLAPLAVVARPSHCDRYVSRSAAPPAAASSLRSART
jgi:hypothetical protein